MSTKPDIEAIERRAEAATPGPWRVIGETDVGSCINGPAGRAIADIYSALGKDNATFIAAARTDVPALVARVRELEAERGVAWREAGVWEEKRDAAIARAEQAERERDQWKASWLEQRGRIEELSGQAAAMRAALRPVLWAFALRMEAALKRNDHKGGWKNDKPGALMKRLREEVAELDEPIRQGIDGNDCVAEEAADVANFAMMLADNSGRLGPTDFGDAGRALLAELVALREVAEAARFEVDSFGGLPADWDEQGRALYAALAELDAMKVAPK